MSAFLHKAFSFKAQQLGEKCLVVASSSMLSIFYVLPFWCCVLPTHLFRLLGGLFFGDHRWRDGRRNFLMDHWFFSSAHLIICARASIGGQPPTPTVNTPYAFTYTQKIKIIEKSWNPQDFSTKSKNAAARNLSSQLYIWCCIGWHIDAHYAHSILFL